MHAGLDLSRRKLDICLLSDRRAHLDQLVVPPDVDSPKILARRIEEVHHQPVCAVIESMTGARIVHDTLEAEGWDVEIAVASGVLSIGALLLCARRRRLRHRPRRFRVNEARASSVVGVVKLLSMAIDVWMQHPTLRFLQHDMFESLRRWTSESAPEEELPLEMTVTAMDQAGVELGLLSAWHGPEGSLISNDEVAGWVAQQPRRFAGLAAVNLNRPMEALRELRRCVAELGFKGLRVVPWLWDAPPTDRRYYPLYAACVELGVPFCTQVGHTGPLRPSETGRPIPYIDQVALDFPELVIVAGHIGYPWTEEMIAVARKHEHVYIDTSAYTARRYPPELVRYMQSKGGRRKVLFGTNYPMIAPHEALEDLDALGLDDEARELFLSANAGRLFKLADVSA